MKLRVWVLFIGMALISSGIAYGYWENYPPFSFKDKSPAHLNVKPLVSGEGDYKSEDGAVLVYLKEPKPFEVEFFLKVGKTVLVTSGRDMEGYPFTVYKADLDNNGHDDFIVFYNSRGPGLGGHQDRVEIYLQRNEGGFEKISYDIFDAGIEDFIGPDRDGKYKVIITGFYQGDWHNYFTYDLYEFRAYQLVNADGEIGGFPKFVQFTDKPNDQDTGRLTQKERLQQTRQKNDSIFYEDVR